MEPTTPVPEGQEESSVPVATEEAVAVAPDGFTWLELLAVLSLAAFPAYLMGFIRLCDYPTAWFNAEWPFPLYAIHAFFLNVFFSIAVLHILARTGETWSGFGLTSPALQDLLWGFVLLAVQFLAWAMWMTYSQPLYVVLVRRAKPFLFGPTQLSRSFAWSVFLVIA